MVSNLEIKNMSGKMFLEITVIFKNFCRLQIFVRTGSFNYKQHNDTIEFYIKNDSIATNAKSVRIIKGLSPNSVFGKFATWLSHKKP